MDRQGREESIPAAPRAYASPRLSPDGSKAAFDLREGNQDIWVWNFASQTLTPLTFNPVPDTAPVWTPDGQRLAFASVVDGRLGLYWQAADGRGAPERIDIEESPVPTFLQPKGFSPDLKHLVFAFQVPGGDRNIGVLDLDGDRRRRPLIRNPFWEEPSAIASDGHWLAYLSEESGRREVYVRPFPAVETGHWQISNGGGGGPVWSCDGRELFYFVPPGRLLVAGSNLMPVSLSAARSGAT